MEIGNLGRTFSEVMQIATVPFSFDMNVCVLFRNNLTSCNQ